MSLRPTGRNKVLVTDSNGKIVSQTNQSSADFTMDDLTCTTVTATTVTASLVGNITGNVTGNVTGNATGGLTATSSFVKFPTPVVATANAVLTAAQSGGTWVGTSASGNHAYTLPAPAAGLTYTIVCGNASGEIFVNTNGSQSITGKGF